GQLSTFLDRPPFNVLPPAMGTFTFTSSLPVAALALRAFINERGDSVFVPLPIQNRGAGVLSDPFPLPLFADGGGWSTEVLLANPTDSVLQGTIQFLDQSGSPAPVNIDGQVSDTFSYEIDPGGATKLVTSGFQAASQAGSILIVPAAQNFDPLAASVISFQKNGVTLSQAASTTNLGIRFQLYAEISGDFDSGAPGSLQMAISISNLSTMGGKVAMELIRMDGSSTGLTGNVDLPAKGQVVKLFNEIP